MREIHTKSNRIKRGMTWLVLACVCLTACMATADGVEGTMPAPPDTPVYWQLTSIEQTPEVRASGGYAVQYGTQGLDIDLADGLLAQSLLQQEDAVQGITLTIEKNDEIVMEHSYQWTPLPVYIEPDVAYDIQLSGSQVAGASRPNSLLGAYVQGEIISRVSAGGYTGHPAEDAFTISSEAGIYRDGRIVVSLILRDVNDMFRDRIVYTYTMVEGVKPEPTPKPGFDPAALEDAAILPSYYGLVRGRDDLWQIITAPDEYRAYGSMNGTAPTFYPSDAEGNVPMNEAPADIRQDYEDFVRGFVPTAPEEVPVHYSATGESEAHFAFVSREGETIGRVYGRVDGEAPGFYAQDAQGNVDHAQGIIDPQTDYINHIQGFGPAEPKEAESFYKLAGEGLYTFIDREGQVHFRAYGRLNGAEEAYYVSNEAGEVEHNATPVVPQEDFLAYIKGFTAQTPDTLPDFYREVESQVYAVEDREGNAVYRVFGIKDGEEPAFYPSDLEGAVEDSAVPVDPQDDFRAFIAGFDMVAPQDVPDFYEDTDTPGVWQFTDRDGQAQYRAHGSLNRQAPAFYPSDAQGNVDVDALPVEAASDRALLPLPNAFAPAVPAPQDVPAFYTAVVGEESLFAIDSLDGEKIYRVFGAHGEGEAAFYPADAQGVIEEGAEPADPQADWEAHLGSFAPQTPEDAQVPELYTAVQGQDGLYAFTDKQLTPIYRVFGAKETAEDATETETPAPDFYPADEAGRVLSGVPADPAADAQIAVPKANGIVATQQPADATSTPLARTHEAEASVEPPAFSATVEPSLSPTDETETVSREHTPAPTEEAPEATDEAPEPTEAAEPTSEPAPAAGGLSTGAIIGIGALVLVVIGGVAYLVARNRKKK